MCTPASPIQPEHCIAHQNTFFRDECNDHFDAASYFCAQPCPHNYMCTIVMSYTMQYASGVGWAHVPAVLGKINRHICVPFELLDDIDIHVFRPSEYGNEGCRLIMSQASTGRTLSLGPRDLKTTAYAVGNFACAELYAIDDLSHVGRDRT